MIRIEHTWAPRLTLDLALVPPLRLDAAATATLTQLAPIVEGKPDVSRITEMDLGALARRFRLQTIVFTTAAEVFDQMAPTWSGSREVLIAQLVPVFDGERPIRSTADMLPWYTGRPWADTGRSHINRCVLDSAWEASEAFALDRHPDVDAWARNDHLGFEIVYVFDGVVRKYRPDFLVRLTTGTMLVLEVKGQDAPQHQARRAALDEWTRAVTQHGGFGRWTWAVSRTPSDLADVLHAAKG